MNTFRYTAPALCVALVGAALALGVPSSAIAAGDTSPASIGFSPDHGSWSDTGAVMTTDFSCLPAADGQELRMSGFISDVGAESPEVPADVLAFSFYPFTKFDATEASFVTDVPVDADGSLPDDLKLDMFMSGSWADSSGGAVPDMATALTPGSTHSFGLYCYDNVSFTYQRDTDGRVHSAWTPLYIRADGSWSFVEGGTPAEPVDTAVDLAGALNADQKSIDLTATVRAASGTTSLPDATGTVTFREGTTVVGTPVVVTSGAAKASISGLAAGDHSFTATYTPDAAASVKYRESPASAATPAITVPKSVDTPVVPGTELGAGDRVTAGTQYKVTLAAKSFTAGDSVSGTIRPDSITLSEKATVAADGSVVYGFTAPAGLATGDHQLVLADAHGGSFQVAFTVAAAAPTPTPSATPSSAPPAAAQNGTPAAGANQAVKFATDWIGGMAATPMGAATLFGSLLLATAVAVAGWLVFWRRRPGATTGRSSAR
ncbi:Ig-like domain-containing protein [Herbiconiux sp. P18]|uniref:Ig-like domain-containing protein n=1 Tax=Herbiconiux liangxiaofengii TaxID=3342795 RepID=UPI003CF981CC